MSTRGASARTGRPFPAMVGYAVRQTVSGRRRSWLLLLVVLAAVGFGLLARTVDRSADAAFANVADLGLFGLVLPLGCLVIGDAVLAAEIRVGTFPLTWLAPVRVSSIVLARWIAGWLIAGVVLGVAGALAAVAAGSPSNAGPVALAAVSASGAYVAVFVLVGAATRRSAVWSLALVFLVEGLLGAALSGIAQYSPQWLGRGVLGGYGTGTADLVRAGVPDGTGAIVRLAMVTVVALALATWRLRNLSLTGGQD